MAAHTTSPYICWICSLASMLSTDLVGYLPKCWKTFILRKFWACDLLLTHRYGRTKHLDCRSENVPLDHSLELRKAKCSQEHPCILQPLLVSRIYRSWRRWRCYWSWVLFHWCESPKRELWKVARLQAVDLNFDEFATPPSTAGNARIL